MNRVQGYVQADYNATDWLSFMYRLGTDNYTDRRTQVFARQSRNAVNGRIIEDVYTWSELNSDLVARAKKQFGDLDANLMLGWNVNQRNLDNVYAQGMATHWKALTTYQMPPISSPHKAYNAVVWLAFMASCRSAIKISSS